MTVKPKRPCNYPRCPELTIERFCPRHKKQDRKRTDEQRGTASQRGYNSRWRKARKTFLSRNPLCKHCNSEGRLTPATIVDHITPHKGNQTLFWNKYNWQPLCKRHHDIKTATEDGGFGNEIKNNR